MAKSFKDALLNAGVIKPEDTDEAKREKSWQERRAKDAAETAARMEDSSPLPQFEAAATGHIVEKEAAKSQAPERPCAVCGTLYDPDAPEHKPFGAHDLCGSCGQDENVGPERKRGQMVWTHKTAPTLEIEGSKPLTPEELAAMRRR